MELIKEVKTEEDVPIGKKNKKVKVFKLGQVFMRHPEQESETVTYFPNKKAKKTKKKK